MNYKNLEELKNSLRYLGFGKKLYPDLEVTMNRNLPHFALLHKTELGNTEVKSSIHFVKSDQSDKYRISKHDTMVCRNADVYDNRIQTFYIHQNNGISLKEAFNLLEGRSVLQATVNKDGEAKSSWVQLDFTREDRAGNYRVLDYGESYGFDLKKSLAMLPIKEMTNVVARDLLVHALVKGNREEVRIIRGDKQENMFIEANPQAKTINVYDSKLQKVEQESMLAHQAADQPKQHAGKTQTGSQPKEVKDELASTNMREAHSRRKGLSH